MKARLWAAKKSVAGGVALKCLFEPGSAGSLNIVQWHQEHLW